MLLWLILAAIVLLGLFMLLQGDTGAWSQQAGPDSPYVIAVAVLLGIYAVWLLMSHQGRLRDTALSLLAWAGIGLVALTGYAYRDEITVVANRVAGELLPPGHVITIETSETGEQAVRLRRRPDGHFAARAQVNGTSTTLMVDTGASTVVLRPLDAQRAGIATSELSFTVPVQTANGTAYAAPVRLNSIKIGPIELRDVEALVAKPGSLEESLLGMSFLTRLRSYEFTGEFLTLRS